MGEKGFDKELSRKAVEVIHRLTSDTIWRTAMRIRDILIINDDLKDNPYIQNHRLFISCTKVPGCVGNYLVKS